MRGLLKYVLVPAAILAGLALSTPERADAGLFGRSRWGGWGGWNRCGSVMDCCCGWSCGRRGCGWRCGGLSFQEATADELIPRRGGGLAVDVGVGAAFRDVDRGFGAHEAFIVSATGAGGGENLIERADSALRGVVVKDRHDVVEVLTLFEEVVSAGGIDRLGKHSEEPVEDVDLVGAKVGGWAQRIRRGTQEQREIGRAS